MDVATLQYLLKRAQKKRKKSHDKENDYESDDDEDAQDFFLNFGRRKAAKKRRNEKRRDDCQMKKLMKRAQRLLSESTTRPTTAVGNDKSEDDDNEGKKKKIVGGATTTTTNPLKKEMGATPSGLDFANQVGALLAQPTTVKMIPPGDETRPSTQPEKISTGVKTETKKVLHPTSNVYDVNMQSRRSFTFEYDGSFHHPRFNKAMIHFSCKVVTTPTAGAGGGAAYQQYSQPGAAADGSDVHSTYGPIIYPNRFPDFYFKKATIELRGGIGIEPTSQTHQETKLVRFYTTTTPEAVDAKYSNMGGYSKDYDSTLESQKYQVPVEINAATGAMQPIAGNEHDYRRITETAFKEGTGINADFRYTTKGAAALSDKFNNGAEVHFQVPLRRICKYAQCDQMSPAEKDFYITLHKMKESFLFTCQREEAHQQLMIQLTNCEIHVPIVELTPEKKKEEMDKINSDTGIAYKLLNDYTRTFYIYPHNSFKNELNVTGGYKPGMIYIYWLDFSNEADGHIQRNNYLLERPNLRTLEVWVNEIQVQEWKPRPGQDVIDWDTLYSHYVEWFGRTINTKEVWMHGKTIIPVKIRANPDEQIKDANYYTLTETVSVRIKQVFNGRPSNRELRLCVQWTQPERLIFNRSGNVTKSWTQNN